MGARVRSCQGLVMIFFRKFSVVRCNCGRLWAREIFEVIDPRKLRHRAGGGETRKMVRERERARDRERGRRKPKCNASKDAAIKHLGPRLGRQRLVTCPGKKISGALEKHQKKKKQEGRRRRRRRRRNGKQGNNKETKNNGAPCKQEQSPKRPRA